MSRGERLIEILGGVAIVAMLVTFTLACIASAYFIVLAMLTGGY